MKKNITRLLLIVLAVLLTISLFASCADHTNDLDSNYDSSLPIRIAVLSGSTGYGAVKLMNDTDNGESGLNYQFSIESSAKIIQDSLISGNLDIAALPTNKASLIYQETNGKIRMIAVNTLGVMYLVTTNGETVNSLDDLRGKTVGIPEEPSYILRALCEKAGLTDGTDVIIETYATPSELNAAVIKGTVAYAVLPEPLLSTAMSKKDTIRISLNLTDEWEKIFDNASLMQGCLVVRTEWADAHPKELKNFLTDYNASIVYVNEHATDVGAMIETKFGTNQAVAQKAIPNCNLVCITGQEMQQKMTSFYGTIVSLPGVNMGNSVPDEGFYLIQ